jgi:signal transduction histidine kinase
MSSILKSREIVYSFTRLAKGHKENYKKINLQNILARINNNLMFELKGHNIDLNYINMLNDNIQIYGKEIEVEQLFFNIIINSVQQIELFYGVRKKGFISIELSPHNNCTSKVLVYVKDTGPGIHGYNINRIFNFGFTTKPDGFGIGLHIAKQIVENMGGQIKVKKSTLFIGTNIEVELPIAK